MRIFKFIAFFLSLLLTSLLAMKPLLAADGDAHVKGVVEAVMLSKHMVKVSHDPVPQWNWPGMKMKFAVAPEVDLSALKEGQSVEMTMVRGADGKGAITEIR